MLSVVILIAVFVLISVRRIGTLRFQIWQVMLGGALLSLVTGQISLENAMRSINPDVMLFLFGMFVVGQALEASGYLSHLSYRLFKEAKSLDALVLFILINMGALSAFLMNDTMAIIGTPVVLLIARRNGLKAKVLLLALAFAVTIGSVMSPIGNPQNLLIALNGNVTNPFVTFLRYLFLPTALNLFLAYVFLRVFYWDQFKAKPFQSAPEPIKDVKLAALCRVSLVLLGVLILAKIIVVSLGVPVDFRLTYIALVAALPILLFSPSRINIVKQVDWYTLVFFAAMFVLMECVWEGGFFQSVIGTLHVNLLSVSMILVVSVVLSQFISNVPMVALYLPMLAQLGASTRGMVALAAGSTIAGNLSILGAASNVIIIQNAERGFNESLTFWDFVKVGVPLTVVNMLVYWLFLTL
ncbi:MAG: SLC13 family permease [Dehalococcoidales bacterium]|nr:SLC13 family permease [Dehalococcoidales bacterium]